MGSWAAEQLFSRSLPADLGAHYLPGPVVLRDSVAPPPD